MVRPSRLARAIVALAVLSAFLLVVVVPASPASAAPFSLRFFTNVPTDKFSIASRFSVVAEMYDAATGLRVNTSGEQVTLELRYLASGIFTTVNNNFAVANTTNGLAFFNNLSVTTIRDDYSLVARSPNTNNLVSSTGFDVEDARVYVTTAIPSGLTTASIFPVTVSVVRGIFLNSPIDTYANGFDVRFSLKQNLGGTVTTLIDNLAQTPIVNGQSPLVNLQITDVTPSGATFFLQPRGLPSSPSGGNTTGFTVEQAYLQLSDPPATVSTMSRFPLSARITRGSGAVAPTDTYADGHVVFLDLNRIVNFSTTVITEDFRTGVTTDGVVTFSTGQITTEDNDYYFASSSTTSWSGDLTASTDVAGAYTQFTDAPTTDLLTNQAFGATVVIKRGAGGPTDTDADGNNMALELFCLSTPEVLNLGTATASDGVVVYSNRSVSTQRTGCYLSNNATGIVGYAYSGDFNVYTPRTVSLSFTMPGVSLPLNAEAREEDIVVKLVRQQGGGTFDDAVGASTASVLQITNRLPGTYDISIKHPRFLTLRLNSVSVPSTADLALSMGEMRPGDANDDNVVNITDFSVLAATFGKNSSAVGYDRAADFNFDSVVNISDFSLLAASFGQAGPTAP